ncbi:MAG: hypothetical protein IKK92_06705, partial [Prevotella sp.]|nr:hypothetical protein [Prevotella sp.]
MKNKATGDVYVQLDVFSMFSKMESLFEEPAETELANSDISFVLENKDDYLEKGNRLISLAREVFHRQIKNFELSGIEEQIYSIKMDKSDSLLDIISKISKKVTRPILK